MADKDWTTEHYIDGWMSVPFFRITLVCNGIPWHTTYFVPDLNKSYCNLGSVRKAIAMFRKRGGVSVQDL